MISIDKDDVGSKKNQVKEHVESLLKSIQAFDTQYKEVCSNMFTNEEINEIIKAKASLKEIYDKFDYGVRWSYVLDKFIGNEKTEIEKILDIENRLLGIFIKIWKQTLTNSQILVDGTELNEYKLLVHVTSSWNREISYIDTRREKISCSYITEDKCNIFGRQSKYGLIFEPTIDNMLIAGGGDIMSAIQESNEIEAFSEMTLSDSLKLIYLGNSPSKIKLPCELMEEREFGISEGSVRNEVVLRGGIMPIGIWYIDEMKDVNELYEKLSLPRVKINM